MTHIHTHTLIYPRTHAHAYHPCRLWISPVRQVKLPQVVSFPQTSAQWAGLPQVCACACVCVCALWSVGWLFGDCPVLDLHIDCFFCSFLNLQAMLNTSVCLSVCADCPAGFGLGLPFVCLPCRVGAYKKAGPGSVRRGCVQCLPQHTDHDSDPSTQVCVCVCVYVCARACMCACVCVCVHRLTTDFRIVHTVRNTPR